MQAHIVLAHPEPRSYNANLAEVARRSLEAQGWSVSVSDLYAMGFDPCERGFSAENFALVSEQDLLGERIARPPRKRKRADQFIAEATEIAEGDLVVHQDYGIGRYDGLETIGVGTAPHDCLRLIYDGSEKLFLPVENIELLSRFGSESGGVALDEVDPTTLETMVVMIALARLGAIQNPLIPILREREVRFITDQVGTVEDVHLG